MKLTNKNKKRILWVAVFIIAPSFILWGSRSLGTRDENVIGKIQDKQIKITDFTPYFEQAQIHWQLIEQQRADTEDIYSLAGDFYLLSYQAQKENIKVTDQEVIAYIKKMPIFQENGSFSSEKYQNYLGTRFGRAFPTRKFEEYIRYRIKREKLFANHIDVDVDEDEVKRIYVMENSKAKISYLLIPYANFKPRGNIPRETLENFYSANKDMFIKGPKIKVNYVSLEPETEKTDTIIYRLPEIESLKELTELEVIESNFFAQEQPIDNIGLNRQLNQYLFSLDQGEISFPLSIQDKILIFEKIEKKEAFLPSLSQIESDLEQAYRVSQAKKNTEKIAKEIIEKIKSTDEKDLSRYASEEMIRFGETDFFKYFDYISGVGIDESISKIAFFQLDQGEVHLKPLNMENGTYIIKLDEKTEIDLEDFAQQKDSYYQLIKENKELYQRFSLLNDLRNDLSFQLRPVE